MPNLAGYFGVSVPKKVHFFAPQGRTLADVSEIRSVYAGNPSTEVVNICCDLVGKFVIYRQKNRDGAFCPKVP